jgi:DNA-binding CsgD family transcriptional regulator
MSHPKKCYVYQAQTKHRTPLAPREVECLLYLLRGHTAKQTARQLQLSYRTVEFYIANVKDKLHCRTRSKLIEKMLTGELIHPNESEGAPSQLIREQQTMIKQCQVLR